MNTTYPLLWTDTQCVGAGEPIQSLQRLDDVLGKLGQSFVAAQTDLSGAQLVHRPQYLLLLQHILYMLHLLWHTLLRSRKNSGFLTRLVVTADTLLCYHF